MYIYTASRGPIWASLAKGLLVVFCISLTTLPTLAQPFSPIEPERTAADKLFDAANTAGQEAYLTESEKTVVLLTNLARLSGRYFVDNYLGFYKDTSSANFQKLKRRLLANSPIQPLRPAFGLYRSAALHANDMGSHGLQGLNSSDGRSFFDRIHQQLPGASAYASNYYLGSGDPLDIVLGLLVAEHDSVQSYQQNLLSPQVDFIGVSIRPHKLECSNTVIDFARRPHELPAKDLRKNNRKKEAYFMDCPTGSKITKVHIGPRKRILGLF